MALDRIDSRILAELQNNGRLSNKELAARVNLAPSSCLERVKRLQADGVLRGFHAEVEPAAVGIGLEALVSIQMARHGREHVDALWATVLARPEVLSVFHLAGATDCLLHVAVRDPDHLRTFAIDVLGRESGVAHVETSLIFAHERRWTLPDYSAPA